MELDERLRELFQDDRLDLPVRPGAEHVIVVGARRRRRARVAVAGALAGVVVLGGAFGAAGLRDLGGTTVGAPPGVETMTVTVPARALEPPAYANFRLGMTDAEARATKALLLPGREGVCTAYSTSVDSGDAVVVSRRHGVVRISLPPKGVTPSGVGDGASLEGVREAYPSVSVQGDRAHVAMAPEWRYVFLLDQGKVSATRIERVGSECDLGGS
ncbi:hypothetical protein FHS29_005416 [Saccharothrix tamanrassetensis]|uniref:Uncharacterized protein n=1 Tax=Saccharothrix tamanrassetensis TaxID=1051531 RepID=A0A841CRZ7_9PSEU|nr:hypothetical protein [Saccharothrix tamanrassetensis]MBB5958807.1 hypothetical protein [Saccharothrix tamanrassetensis]